MLDEKRFTHFNEQGRGRMVDVTEKNVTFRVARAQGKVRMQESTLREIKKGTIAKGDVLGVAQVAGVLGAKQTPQLIPMCHPLLLTGVDLNFSYQDEKTLVIEATVKNSGQTGVEMEALTAVSIAALTVYDMCKAIDRGMEILEIRLMEKKGGKSGHYFRGENQ
ncbi:MAG TPA: cyclic pyranopterin monophosphate synthase MoaC [Firmicutes bacterium]|jgi:cyclic pyranopterin phosphate synthase|nr:cyclic pyranopterin monophosphate synthase MoaC [Bacillota bacterium]